MLINKNILIKFLYYEIFLLLKISCLNAYLEKQYCSFIHYTKLKNRVKLIFYYDNNVSGRRNCPIL